LHPCSRLPRRSLILLFASGLAGRTAHAALPIPPDQGLIGTYETTPGFEIELHSLRPGDTIRFDANGRTYVGTYAGQQAIGGVMQQTAINVRDIGPSGPPGASVADSSQQPAANSAIGGNAPASGGKDIGNGAASSAEIAGGIQAVYRLAFVSPQLERELGAARSALDAASAARSAAVERYKLTIDRGVEHASQALRALKSDFENGHVETPRITVLQRSTSIEFDVADTETQLRMASSYYTAINAPVSSPVQKISQAMCISGLDLANGLSARDRVAQNGVLITSESFARFLRSSTDLLLGIDPITGLVRDTVELVTGANIVTGQILSDEDRTLRAILAGANLVTLGASGTVEGGFRLLARVTENAGGAGGGRVKEIFAIADGLPFTKHGWQRFNNRRWIKELFEAENGAALTPDWIRRTIEESTPYWDRAEKTIAFHSEHEAGDWWLRVAIDKEPDSVIVTVIPQGKPFNLNAVLKDGSTPRFVPYEEKVPNLFTFPPH
jgi:hypothetical protein